MITKRDSISRGCRFCEKYIYYKNKFKTERNEKTYTQYIVYNVYLSHFISQSILVQPSITPSLYVITLNVCASSHSLLSPNPSTLSLSIFLNLLVLSLTIYISHFCYGPLAFYMYVILSTTLFQKA